MLKRTAGILLALTIAWTLTAAAGAEESPVTAQEMYAFIDGVRALALAGEIQNDPAGEDALSEDGILFQYEFGAVYGDRAEMTPETKLNAFLIMDPEAAGPRGIAVDWDVNRVMEAVPCGNPQMYGNREQALLYLTGNAEEGFSYGLAERDGQRIEAIEYGTADPAEGVRLVLSLHISGDGIASVRMEGMNAKETPEDMAALYGELERLRNAASYARVPRNADGSKLEMFQESDLDFSALSYQTAVPEIFGDNVEDMLIDNDDGTWLRRVDGDGFSAVFTCDEKGGQAELISYTILSPDLEGPRGVRLGDLFHEDFQRFRNGEGETDEAGTREVLYGREGQAPYALAEYGTGDEMVLRYITDTLSGTVVELLLRYEGTVLTEITLHTL